MFNKIILVGNLTHDIELKFTSGGTALAKTSIATTRKFTVNGERKEEVCFVDITFFGRSAEIANQYLRKGSKCLVEGRLMFEQWTDQQGQKRSKHSVTVESMQMLDSKNDNQRESHTAGNDTPGENQTGYGVQQNEYGQPAQQQYQQPDHVRHENVKADQPPAQQPASYQPQQSIPEYDIDEDEIPF